MPASSVRTTPFSSLELIIAIVCQILSQSVQWFYRALINFSASHSVDLFLFFSGTTLKLMLVILNNVELGKNVLLSYVTTPNSYNFKIFRRRYLSEIWNSMSSILLNFKESFLHLYRYWNPFRSQSFYIIHSSIIRRLLVLCVSSS